MYSTSCHCGAVRLEMTRRPRKLTACNCSICRRYGAIWAYFRRKSVRVLCEPGALHTYTWRRGTRVFCRCRSCGCVTHYEHSRQRPDGTDTLAVNVRNIDQPSIVSGLPIRLLDGASSWEVLEETVHPELFESPRR